MCTVSMNVFFVAFVIVCLWGITPIIHKYLLESISAPTLMVLNSIIYFFGICTIAWIHRSDLWNDSKHLQKHHLLFIAIAAIIGIVIANYLYFRILQLEKSYVITALLACSPLITFFLSVLFLHEKVTTQAFLGVLCIVIGVILLSF